MESVLKALGGILAHWVRITDGPFFWPTHQLEQKEYEARFVIP